MLHELILAAPAAVTPKGVGHAGANTFLNVSFGSGALILAFAAEWVLKKRTKHPKVSRALMWIAWVFALVGGESVSREFPNTMGVTSAGAAVVTIVMLFFIAADVADKRPDWTAMILTATVPWFMRLTGGTIGHLFAAVLSPVQALGLLISGALGM